MYFFIIKHKIPSLHNLIIANKRKCASKRLKNGKLATYIDDDRTIIINPDIIKYRKEILEYTVLYEFCHLKYKKRVKGFKDMLKTYMPDYQYYEFVNSSI